MIANPNHYVLIRGDRFLPRLQRGVVFLLST